MRKLSRIIHAEAESSMDLFFLILDLAPDRCAACAAIFDVKRSSTQWISTEGQRLEIFSKLPLIGWSKVFF